MDYSRLSTTKYTKETNDTNEISEAREAKISIKAKQVRQAKYAAQAAVSLTRIKTKVLESVKSRSKLRRRVTQKLNLQQYKGLNIDKRSFRADELVNIYEVSN